MYKSDSTEASSEREIVTTRVFDAPRELVFKAWTDPRHLVHWWGPNGFTTRVYRMDVRPGGIWRLVMRGPDGVDYHNKLVFIEVVEPERLVYKHVGDEECEPANHQVTVTFAAEGNSTKVTMRMVFPSAAARAHVVNKYGAIEGATQTFGRLAEHLAKVADGKWSLAEARPKCDIRITRIIDAPRELVFQAWTDPKHVAQWWGPKGFTNSVSEWDARPNGTIRLNMHAPDGFSHPMTGVFHEVVPSERIVFTAVAEDEAGNRLLEALTTVTFNEQGGKTRLTVDASAVGFADVAVQMLAGMELGWAQSLERLDHCATHLD
jgi:uncharacterized protein YndB with AHSA1/START domain